MDKETGGPAFPVPNDANVNEQEGMTLRDHIAVAAMNGELSSVVFGGEDSGGLSQEITDSQLDTLARHWYRIADAMLRVRSE